MGTDRVACPVCGQAGNHEDERHRHVVLPDRALTTAKPPYEITDFIRAGYIEAGTIKAGHVELFPPGAVGEAQRRARNRAIADAHARELAEHRGHQAVMGEWHDGTCSGCGMDDLPVIGLPGSELCRWCEELRQLVPVPEAQEPIKPAPSRDRPASLSRAETKRLTCAFACAVIGLALGLTDVWFVIPLTLLIASFVLSKTV